MSSLIQKSAGSVPIPAYAIKVFEGRKFSIYQWEQPGANGVMQKFEKARKRGGVAVIPVTEEGEILLIDEVKNSMSVVSLPTGGVDDGEDVLAAAQRELLEETGYVSDDWELWFSYEKDSHIDSLSHVFVARGATPIRKGDLGINGEKIRIKPVDFEQFVHFASDERFRNSYLIPKILQARLNPDRMEDLYKLLYKS